MRKGKVTPLPSVTASDLMWNEERAGSMDRALRIGQILFRLENYKPVMLALDKLVVEKGGKQTSPTAKEEFINACGSAGLEPEETRWLWNYLQYHSHEYDWACPGDGW